MKVRFEEDGQLVEEVVYPHAELPLGDEITLFVKGARVRYCVLDVGMLAEDGELKALVSVKEKSRLAVATG